MLGKSDVVHSRSFLSSKPQTNQLWVPQQDLVFVTSHDGVYGGQAFDIIPLTPNDPYRGRTAPLTSKRCILYIYLTNIGTEYFKHGI